MLVSHVCVTGGQTCRTFHYSSNPSVETTSACYFTAAHSFVTGGLNWMFVFFFFYICFCFPILLLIVFAVVFRQHNKSWNCRKPLRFIRDFSLRMLDDQPVYMIWKLLWKHGGENLLPLNLLDYFLINLKSKDEPMPCFCSDKQYYSKINSLYLK